MVMMALPDEELRYWLANEDWYPSRFTQNWTKTTPRAEAADILTEIAKDAQPQPPGFLSRFALMFAATGFATSSGITGGGPRARKAGVRAALMLADLADPRAIPPLVRVFDAYSFWQSKYEAEIETSLTRLLSQAVERGEAGVHASDARTLANQIIQDSRKRPDLSVSLAELLIAALRYLHAAGGAENMAVLRENAAALVSRPTTQPNRARVKATAESLLASLQAES